MSAAPANGTAPAPNWEDAVRDRRAKLQADIEAGRKAKFVLDEMATVRLQLSGLAEDQYRKAWAALERAASELANYDTQSQGALDASRERTRVVCEQLRKLRMEAAEKPGQLDSDVQKLEREHTDAHAADDRLLEARTAGRGALESRYDAAARDALVAGTGMLVSMADAQPRLERIAGRGDLAAAALKTLEKVEPGHVKRVGGPDQRLEMHYTIYTIEALKPIGAVRHVLSGKDLRGHDTHRDGTVH